jgi:prevent-host-death family protein
MARKHSISEARIKLPKLVREAEAGRAVELTRRGERVAVLIGHREYEHLVMRSRRFSEAWAEFISAVKLEDLEIDPDEVFGGTRDKRPGRRSGL